MSGATIRTQLLAAIRSGDAEDRHAVIRRCQARPGSLTRVAEKLVQERILKRPDTGPGYLLVDPQRKRP